MNTTPRTILQPLLLLLSLLLAAPSVQAQEYSELDLEWHMFGSVGLSGIDTTEGLDEIRSPYNNYKNDLDLDELSKIGLQARVNLEEDWHFTLQASVRGALDYKPSVEFAYITHRLNPQTQLRLGRIRRPLFQYSDSMNVAYAYNWTRPPVMTYFNYEGFYAPITAVDLNRSGRLGVFDYTMGSYFGIGSRGSYNYSGMKTRYSTRFNGGLNLGLEYEGFNAFVGASFAEYSFEIDGLFEMLQALNLLGYSDLAERTDLRNGLVAFYSAGLRYLAGPWEFSGEATVSYLREELLSQLSGGYVAVARELNEDYILTYTLSRQVGDFGRTLLPDVLSASAEALERNDLLAAYALQSFAGELNEFRNDRTAHTISFRYDFDPHAALKLEYEHMKTRYTNDSHNSVAIVLDFVF